MKLKKYIFCIGSIVLLISPTAFAQQEPLSLFELDALSVRLHCDEACQLSADYDTCKLGCTPDYLSDWDKNRDKKMGDCKEGYLCDFELAILEYWDEEKEKLICYESDLTPDNQDDSEWEQMLAAKCIDNCRVRPISLCGSTCTGPDIKCLDQDGDGIGAEQEDWLGSADSGYNAACDKGSVSCHFGQTCIEVPDALLAAGTIDQDKYNNKDYSEYVDLLDASAYCLPVGEKDEYTAFSLTTVTQNNNEVIVYVNYNDSPIGATVIDLYLDYNVNALQLIDTRPMFGNDSTTSLYASHVAPGRLRLVLVNDDSIEIKKGTVVELVFNRISPQQTTIGFTKEDHLQDMALAPDMGKDENGDLIRKELHNDALWGADVQVSAADPNGPRLLLYYSFDNPNNYLDYKDAKDGVELCELDAKCSVLSNTLPHEKVAKEKLISRFDNLQRGTERVSSLIDGVVGTGAYFDGGTDHLEFPVTLNDPIPHQDGFYYYMERDQTFSLSMWFYSEGVEFFEEGEAQILFSRNNNVEETRFGLMLVREDIDVDGEDVPVLELWWFEKDFRDDDDPLAPPSGRRLATVDPLKWTHIGMVLDDHIAMKDDDKDGLIDNEDDDEFDYVSFYLNGELIDDINAPNVDDNRNGQVDEAGEKTAKVVMGEAGKKYVDGNQYRLNCPYPMPAGGLQFHEEGNMDITGDPPETIFFSSAENNLFGIEKMDPTGLDRSKLIRDGVSAARDADYSPLLDKIVYSSSKNGNYDIWIADGDGTNARQITQGFGDTARGIFARRPKWAPDGSAIVFDSNVFSFDYMDNWWMRVYQLYYIGYDASKNEVAVELMDGSTLSTLDYDVLGANQIIDDFRISEYDSGKHYYEAKWMMGDSASGDNKGILFVKRADDLFKQKEILMLTIGNRPWESKSFALSEAIDDAEQLAECPEWGEEGNPGLSPDYTLLDAYYSFSENQFQSQLLYKKQWVKYEGTEQAEVNATAVAGVVALPVWKSAAEGWGVEDLTTLTVNSKVGIAVDIHLNDVFSNNAERSELKNAFVSFDPMVASPLLDPETLKGDNNQISNDQRLFYKTIGLFEQYTTAKNFVKVRVTSPIDSEDLPDYAHIATVNFQVTRAQLEAYIKEAIDWDPNAPKPIVIENFSDTLVQQLFFNHIVTALGLAAFKRDVKEELRMAELGLNSDANIDVKKVAKLNIGPELDFISAAAFSPDGNRLVLSAIQDARPVLLRSLTNDTLTMSHPVPGVDESPGGYNVMNDDTDRYGKQYTLLLSQEAVCETRYPLELTKISLTPMNVSGMDWERIERYYPCTWMGAYKDPYRKLYTAAFAGGIDEVKYYSYVREPDAFLSDYQRGEAWVVKDANEGTVPEAYAEDCLSNSDCPPYKLCNTNEEKCYMQECDPEGEGVKCKGGICTMMPVPVALENVAEPIRYCEDDSHCDDGTGSIVDSCQNGVCVGMASDGHKWVCSAECSSDQQCFTQECLNGPCRFCGEEDSCLECRDTTEQITPQIKLEYIEGCPDRNSFYCDAGSCITECYSFENGESIYLCDPALEYCREGRCKMFDWDWMDLSPMTFAGAAEMTMEEHSGRLAQTVAIPQIYPVEIVAYGVEDYLDPPTIVVEGQTKFGPYGLDTWFEIGKIAVFNKDEVHAKMNPYIVHSPYPVWNLRVRMIAPHYQNRSGGNTGLGGTALTTGDECTMCVEWQKSSEPFGVCGTSLCRTSLPIGMNRFTRQAGSRVTLGYPAALSERFRKKDCADRTGSASACGYSYSERDIYLTEGQHTVFVLSAKANGQSGSQPVNMACGYYQAVAPIGTDADADSSASADSKDPRIIGDKPVDFKNGYINLVMTGTNETSNQSARFKYTNYKDKSETSLYEFKPEEKGFALLNCTVNNNGKIAGVEYKICVTEEDCGKLYPVSGRVRAIQEDVTGCSIERGMRSTPCYEWYDNDVSVDYTSYMEGAYEPWHTLDFDYYRSFGYDE